MNALFVGLGSIGARHLKNLAAACEEKNIPLNVTALRFRPLPLAEDIALLVHAQITQLDENLAYDIAFITNPTNLHADILAKLKGRVGSFFIEKPIFENGDYSLEQLGLGETQKAYVAAPMRWCQTYIMLKKQLENTPVYSVRAICSSYLPGWRPDADYRKIYSAIKEMGGGVTLDLIHEWDYITDLFGMPQKTLNMRGTYSHLEINSDDLSVYIAKYPGFLCEVHLDYFGMEYRRTLEVFSKEGTIIADFGKGTLTLCDGTTLNCTEPVNTRYVREMNYFLGYALGGEVLSLNSPAKALAVLQISENETWQI